MYNIMSWLYGCCWNEHHCPEYITHSSLQPRKLYWYRRKTGGVMDCWKSAEVGGHRLEAQLCRRVPWDSGTKQDLEETWERPDSGRGRKKMSSKITWVPLVFSKYEHIKSSKSGRMWTKELGPINVGQINLDWAMIIKAIRNCRCCDSFQEIILCP